MGGGRRTETGVGTGGCSAHLQSIGDDQLIVEDAGTGNIEFGVGGSVADADIVVH